ncbi:MAG: hypothetical protein FWD58_11295, partial [Firmicutes bacterium]|nr:hypothetical protein [Bacillota bacterium]
VRYVEIRRVKNLDSDACVIADSSYLLCEWNLSPDIAVNPMNCACFDRRGKFLGYVRDIEIDEKRRVQTIQIASMADNGGSPGTAAPTGTALAFSPARLLSYSDYLLIFSDSGKPMRRLAKKRVRVPKNAESIRVKVHGGANEELGVRSEERRTNFGVSPVGAALQGGPHTINNVGSGGLPGTAPTGSGLPGSAAPTPNSSDISHSPLLNPNSQAHAASLPFRVPPENTQVSRTPQKEPPGTLPYAFLLGRVLSRPICADGGTLLAAAGSVISEKTIQAAKSCGKLVHLALYAD